MIQESEAGLTIITSFEEDVPYSRTFSNDDDDKDELNMKLSVTERSERGELGVSRNITAIMIYTYLSFVARSLWNSNALPIFVFLLCKVDDIKTVGFITGLTGMTQLLSSYPASWVADRYRRDRVVIFGSIMGIVSATLTLIAAQRENLTLLAIGLACWGLFQGMVNPSVWALLADSVNSGDRSLYFSKRLELQFYGRTTGPILSLIMLYNLGIEDWTIETCAAMIKLGQCISIIELFSLFFMSDDFCVNERQQEQVSTPKNSIDLDSKTVSLLEDEENIDITSKTHVWFNANRIVPICVGIADLFGGISTGMAVRYFPVFFMDDLNLSPYEIQWIYLFSNLLLSWTSRLGQYSGIRIGRLETSIIMKIIGSCSMFGMVACYRDGPEQPQILLLVVLYLIRNAAVMGTGALTRSVLMDHVPKNERSRWNSVEAVTNFSWAGSAALGGLLVDAKGLLYVFSFSSWFVLFTTIPYGIAIYHGVIREVKVQR